MGKPYFQRKVTAGVVLSAVLTVVTSTGALWSHTEKVHAWSHQSAAAVGESMSVVYGKQNKNCPQFQAFGFPTPKTDGVVERSYSTCRLGYAGMYDAEVKTPLWVAERIKRDDLKGVAKRDGLDFQDDPQVPPLDGGNQYKRSGFDKGHLAPAADFRWSQEAMNQSFIFSNAVPQNPTHNQKIWGNLESMVREMASRRGVLLVFTGPVFTKPVSWLHHGRKSQERQSGSIPVPAALFKVIVDPATKDMTAFVIPNDGLQGEEPSRFQLSVREVERVTGLDFNPDLSRSEADRLEANGDAWVLPKVRGAFRE